MMADKYWLKLYYEILNDEKVMLLPVNLRWRFIECLILAGEMQENGYLPSARRFSFRTRSPISEIEHDLEQMAQEGLVDCREGRWFVRNYEKRQGPSPNARRQQRWRESQKAKTALKKEQKQIQITDTEADSYGNVTSNVTRNGGALRNVTETLQSTTEQAASAFTDIFGALPASGSTWVEKWQTPLEGLVRACDGNLDNVRVTLEKAHALWSRSEKRYPANSPASVAWAITEVLQKRQANKPAPPSTAQRIRAALKEHGQSFDAWPADIRQAAAVQDWSDERKAIAMTALAVTS